MNENFIVIDATDDIVIGGFGNLEGNLGLLKYSYEEISQKMKESNNKEDDIRLVNSLLDSIRELQQENQKYKEVFDKVEEYIKKRINSCTAEANSTTNDTMCRITIIGLKHLLDILKEVE